MIKDKDIPKRLEFGNEDHIKIARQYEQEHDTENKKQFIVTRERVVSHVEQTEVEACNEEEAKALVKSDGDLYDWDEIDEDEQDAYVTNVVEITK